MATTTWNPSDQTANITLSGGNLIATSTTPANGGVRAIDKQVTGKFYWEITCNTISGNNAAIGISGGSTDLTLPPILGNPGGIGRAGVQGSGQVWVDGLSAGVSLGALANGSLVCVAIDCDARLVWFRLGAAGNWNNNATFNPATRTGGVTVTSLNVGVQVYPTFWSALSGQQVTANFGGSAFTGAVPAGFTSGFTAGVISPANAVSTQVALEEWVTQAATTNSFVHRHASRVGALGDDGASHACARTGPRDGDGMTHLTPHFSLDEFTHSQMAARQGINNVPAEGSHARVNLHRTAETLEKVREILEDYAINISSGYRAPKVNAMIGGAKNSAHTHGLAVDFTCPGFGTPLEICKALEPHMAELEIDQLIHEFSTWVHLGLRDSKPRHQALTIDKKGTRPGFR